MVMSIVSVFVSLDKCLHLICVFVLQLVIVCIFKMIMFTFFLIVLFMDAAFVNQIALELTQNDEFYFGVFFRFICLFYSLLFSCPDYTIHPIDIHSLLSFQMIDFANVTIYVKLFTVAARQSSAMSSSTRSCPPRSLNQPKKKSK